MFNEGIQVRHLNGDKLDFNEKNIAIGTQRENIMDIPQEKRIELAKKAASKLRKFKIGEVEEIRKMIKYGIKANKVSKLYKVSKATISFIVNKKIYINN